jgi:DNA-binding MarR family transcriptional regulator
MDQPDAIIHQPARLKIMAALRALPPREQLEFMRLKNIVGTTDGNLGSHLVTLEEAGYLEVEKDFLGKKPRTRVRLTSMAGAHLRTMSPSCATLWARMSN